MLNTLLEQPMPLADAAKNVRTRPVSRATIYRWAQSGIGGVVLETIRVGGSRCTTREALQRFFEELSKPKKTGLRKRTAKQRLAASRAAERRLINRGV